MVSRDLLFQSSFCFPLFCFDRTKHDFLWHRFSDLTTLLMFFVCKWIASGDSNITGHSISIINSPFKINWFSSMECICKSHWVVISWQVSKIGRTLGLSPVLYCFYILHFYIWYSSLSFSVFNYTESCRLEFFSFTAAYKVLCR